MINISEMAVRDRIVCLFTYFSKQREYILNFETIFSFFYSHPKDVGQKIQFDLTEEKIRSREIEVALSAVSIDRYVDYDFSTKPAKLIPDYKYSELRISQLKEKLSPEELIVLKARGEELSGLLSI